MRMTRPLILAMALAMVACGSPEERAAGHLEKAEQFLEQGDTVKAKLEAQNAAQIQPKNAQARMLLAKIAEKDGEYRAAIGHLLVAVDADPDFVEARIKLGNYYFLGRAAEQAREQADAALKLAPDNAEAHLLNARVKYLEKDLDAAVAEVERALELDPALVDAIMFRAGLYAEQEKFDEAFAIVEDGIGKVEASAAEPLRLFRLALLRRSGKNEEFEQDLLALARDFPDKLEYQYGLAQFYAGENRVDDAERVIRELIASRPEETQPKLALVRLLAARRSQDDAVAAMQKFVEDDPQNLELRLALGSLYETYGRSDEAYATYEELARLAGREKEGLAARNRMVVLKLRAEDLDAARALNDAILDDVPDEPRALLVRAAFHYSEGKLDDAIADLRVVLRKEEGSERALLLLARSYLRNGDAVLAQETYRRLLAVRPGHEEASRELAALLATQGDPDAAEEVLRARLDVDPEDAQAKAALVQTLLAQQDIEAAEVEARSLVDVNADNALAQFQLGRVLQAKGSVDEAVQAYKLTLEEDPNAMAALQGLVGLLVQNGRSAEALDYIQSYLQQNPGQPVARLLLGGLYARMGERDKAREVYESLIAEQPKAAQPYVALASLEEPGSEEQRAIYRRGYEANPQDPSLALLLTTSLEKAGRYDEAMQIYEKLIESNPDNLIAVNNLAALLLDRRDDAASHQRALELAKRLEKQEQPALLDTVGWAYYRNGDFGRAVRLLERAVAGAPNLAVLHYHLGMAYLRNNNPVGAKQELKKALESEQADFPGLDEARSTLAELENA